MALIKITKRRHSLGRGTEHHASPRSQDDKPGWLTWIEGTDGRVWVSEDDAEELDPHSLTEVTTASVRAWLERDGRSNPDLAEAMYKWDLEVPADGADAKGWAQYSRALADKRGRGAARIREAVKRGSLSTSLATDLAHAIGVSVEDLLFHGLSPRT